MSVILESDLKVLEEQSDRTLAEWYCTLNSWGWPDALFPPEEIFKEWRPDTRRSRLMGWIHEKIGERLVSYVWNTWLRQDTAKMTDEQFEEWWGKHGS